MKITDLNGIEIEVTDLSLAIMQADDYRHYQLSGSANTDYNHPQQVYWEDIYLKLIIIAEQSERGADEQSKI
ncbi:hypothetical protein MTO98_07375 [Mucilaginibacter sp. SMC90]|uniref:hypothetical protein n=1 Tax=Mucilaginibacter sp. SMC90 TaxID=2929803 RepID=UPI001FB55BDC|nr:hypothetical protein [Mucilaginibacter sp. SMC90]UOE50897.1 hypothetical protein MTO98_07375 [Mucilaginibacter sp. SMC90]